MASDSELPPHLRDAKIPRSAVRSWVIGQSTGNARVVVVKPRDLPGWLASIEAGIAAVERTLAKAGIAVENDEERSSPRAG